MCVSTFKTLIVIMKGGTWKILVGWGNK